MTPERWQRVKTIFAEAQAQDPERWHTFLDEVCADDPLLREEVTALLQAHVRSGPVDDLGAAFASPLRGLLSEQAKLFAYAGPYRIVREIGRGGMGAVYLGERKEPFRQYVAIKLIHTGMDSGDLLRRFEIERQILAGLNHPNIARLIDGGTTEDGLPYLAMEHVEGKPITAYCDERRLAIEERLRLFQTVCRAVHYAHQNLVVHRDLKPSNILVTSGGQAKLLDFGVAKLLNPSLTSAEAPVTRTVYRVMTPEYASPEQARGDMVTTASDVYTLGILLYELLTGRRPYRITSSSPIEIERIICTQEPARPSTLVRQAAAAPDETGPAFKKTFNQAFGVSPDAMMRRLRGDLDAICLKAIRKEPHLRYASAEQLADDVQRYLTNQPVTAHHGTRGYHFRKFVARHRATAISAGVFTLLLVSFSVVVSMQSAEIRARNRVIAQERDRAQLEANKATEVSAFLASLFQMSDPTHALGDTLTAPELLALGAARIERDLADQPATLGALMTTIGEIYYNLGLYDDAVRTLDAALTHQQRAFGERSPEAAYTMLLNGMTLREADAYETSESVLRTVLDILNALEDPEPASIANGLTNLATTLRMKGDFTEAERLLLEALEREERLATNDPRLRGRILNNLGHIRLALGDYTAAESLHREVLTLRQSWHGPAHPEVANTLTNIGEALGYQGRFAESEALFRESLDMRREIQGAYHPDVTFDLARYATLLSQKGDLVAAESLYREAFERLQRLYPRGSPRVTLLVHQLSDLLVRKGDPEEAERLLRAHLEEELERPHSAGRIASTQAQLAVCLTATGRFTEAESFLLASYSALEGLYDAEHRQIRKVLTDLVNLYESWGKPEQASTYQASLEMDSFGAL